MSTAAVAPPKLGPGSIIGDLWVVRSVLGAGAMGSVLLCHNRHAPRIVAAIKLLGEEWMAQPDARARFAREAEMLYGLDHPNIVKVRNVRLDGAHPHLEMEHVEGSSLEELIQSGPVPLETALLFAEQIASAVRYLHRHGVCHRDIKPANVLVWRHAVVKLVDFGLALESWADRITEVGVSFGTVSYAPPEWMTPEDLDPHGWDLYAIGVVLYEMLTGSVAFPSPPGGTPRQTAVRVMTEKQNVPHLDPGDAFPDSVRTLVRHLTAFARQDRPKTARDLVETLQGLLAERGIDADRRLIEALGEDDLSLHVALELGRRETPLAGRWEQTSQPSEPPRPVATIPPRPPAPLTAKIAAGGAVAAVVAVSLLVGIVGGARWNGTWLGFRSSAVAALVPPASLLAATDGEHRAPEPLRTPIRGGPLVSEVDFAAWLDDHKEWGPVRAVRQGRADEGYLDGFDERVAGGHPMVGVSYQAAAAFCADRGGVARAEVAPATWSGSVGHEWRTAAGTAALVSRAGAITPRVSDVWVEKQAGFRCAR